MDYEDDEILFYYEDEIIEDKKLWNVNLAILMRPSKGTFDVVKNRSGKLFTNASLNYLDNFLETPTFDWSIVKENN